jgi:transcription factor CP2-like protein
MEREQMAAWQASRPGDRIVEVDIPLSYGIYDVVQDQYLLNTVEFLWDPTKEVGVYIKVCTILLAFLNVSGLRSLVISRKLDSYIFQSSVMDTDVSSSCCAP